ncbi:MAG TPA: peroxiredoxin [Oceanospirillales bacterium]|nr:peroxiredoxin [Oceanospirillales bacterium]
MINIGDKVENKTVLLTGNKQAHLHDFLDKYLVLYFYPKANTPGCTTESNDFNDLLENFQKLKVNILGASKDTLKRQENFKAKYGFRFDLIADEQEDLCHYFDVIKEKKNYGRTYLGIVRSTFLIDDKGILIHEWRNLRVKNHAQSVLDYISQI